MSPRRPLPDRKDTEPGRATRTTGRAAFAFATLLLLILVVLILWIRFG